MNFIKILDVRVDDVGYNQVIKTIQKYIKLNKPHQICTVNPEYILQAQEDDELKHIVNNSSLNTADGGGIYFASLYLKKPIKYKVTGIDLIYKIAKLSSTKKYKIFLLGGFNNAAKQTASVLKNKYPGCNIVGYFEGHPQTKHISKKIWKNNYQTKKTMDLIEKNPLLDKTNMKIINKVTQTKPHILLVAYGCPKQDKFIARYKKYLNVPVMIGVGGSFDYISKKISRAPKIMRQIHLEWLYRLIHEPKKRFYRIINAVIVFPYRIVTNYKK
jgi:N-acetylglucosaminyldiphosphoundecaprenol N-acetyl-beta-D-mannosaminyltransferase